KTLSPMVTEFRRTVICCFAEALICSLSANQDSGLKKRSKLFPEFCIFFCSPPPENEFSGSKLKSPKGD
ncbi:hypothetical protein KJ068_27950, partial [bacterium]|nr:hypothetical protein [bacterium]